MNNFNHHYSKRAIQETADALALAPIELRQTNLDWKVFIKDKTVYIDENPDCCVAFLDGIKWACDNVGIIASAQKRMERAMERHFEAIAKAEAEGES